MRNILPEIQKMMRLFSFVTSSLSSRSGFSLIELMVVFSIITIVSGIGFVSFKSYSDRQIISSNAQDIKLAVETAKFNAVSAVKQSGCVSSDALRGYNFNLNPASKTYSISILCGINEYVVKAKKVSSQVAISSGSTCSKIEFESLTGQISGANCTIILSGYNQTVTLMVDSLGSVSIN